ncbi:hypothetical protein MBRU_16885 [Mycolicibacterium brumae DSM 44177]|nr:hypothetical protein MBRU_16885 [Mycolicibacterium brumae DSM 44177]
MHSPRDTPTSAARASMPASTSSGTLWITM